MGKLVYIQNHVKSWLAGYLGIVSPSRYFTDSTYARGVNERYRKMGLPDLITYVEEALEAKEMTPSPQQVITNILKRERTTDEILEWMTREGISIVLNWGEDTAMWECDFINGVGKRYSSVGYPLRKAIRECIKRMAQVELGLEPFQFKSLEDY